MKIMVCYDGSEASKEAFRVAAEYAKAFSASLRVVTSSPQSAESGQGGSVEDDESKKEMAEFQATAQGIEIDFVAETIADDVTDGENLVAYAVREKADAVFLGVRKVSKVGKLLFGSTAQYVILAAPCPVISVKAAGA